MSLISTKNNNVSENIDEVVKMLPILVAYDIQWDTDGNQEILDSLPKEIQLPDGMVDTEEVSVYLYNVTGFCHEGFNRGIKFRGITMPYNTNWLDNDTFQMWFGEGIFKDYEGDNYLIKLEKHLKDNEWVVEVIWEDDCTTINRICNADDYITANEIWKIERICERMNQLDQNADNQCFAVKTGETYKFAGYDWTVCEVDNKRHSAVIQSHGVTHGAWPGFAMQKFGGKVNDIYRLDIDGEDISAYDNKMKELYDNIKEVENTSATYGKGLYIISKDKSGFAEWGEPGSGNYWQALKKAAENACQFGSPNNSAWLGTVYGSSYAWCVNSNGYVYFGDGQCRDFVVAPAFNLDLSKVEVVGNEIVIKDNIKNVISDAKTAQQSIDIKIPGGILHAVECMDPDYPGIDISFIPDEKGNYNEPIFLPRVLIEKPVDNEKLRAIVWNNEKQEDPTFKIEF